MTSARGPLASWLWVIVPPLVLTLPAVALRITEAPQIRYEELAESIRGPFWLEHRLVYDGSSTNVAWYGLLLLVYNIFGFGLTTAKWARVAFLALSLIALSTLLHRHLRRSTAVLALAAIAISPSLLYLNRITTSYGTDLLILPFCLLLLDDLWRRRRTGAPLAPTAAALGAVAMLGAMIYPAMLMAVPFLAAWAFAALPRGQRLGPGLAGTFGFMLPLAIATLVMREPRSLYWDPVERAGIFRGGAVGWVSTGAELYQNVAGLGTDLFRDGSSYYFELRSVEFGGWLGAAAFAAVALLGIAAAWKLRDTRPILATALGAALIATIAASAAGGPPGLRRATAALAAFYLVVATLWRVIPRLASRPWARAAIAGALLLLPLHHTLAYADHLEQSKVPVWGHEKVWFAVEPTIQASLERWLAHTAAGRPLDCGVRRTPGRQVCGYDYIYATLGGFRRWNGEPPIDILAIDPKSGETVLLSPYDWRSLALEPVRNRPSKAPT